MGIFKSIKKTLISKPVQWFRKNILKESDGMRITREIKNTRKQLKTEKSKKAIDKMEKKLLDQLPTHERMGDLTIYIDEDGEYYEVESM